MAEVLIGHSYFLRFDAKLWRAMQPYPPLATLYAAAMLRDRGHDVRLFDAMLASSTDEWAAALERQQPRLAVLYEDNFNYLSKMCLLRMRQAAFEMIAAARERGCFVVVGGADVTDHPGDYLAHGADVAVTGEGEETLCELVGALDAGVTDLRGIDGVVLPDGQGGLVCTAPRPNLRDLDALPLPARDLLDLEAYRAAWQRHGRFSMNLVTSRGCPFHCNWCAKPIWGQRYNVRSPDAVADEIEALKSLGVEHLWFMDDILGLKPGWLPEFARCLEARGLRMPFKCLARADLLLRPGEIEALARAGCEMVWIGAESGSQRVLDAMEKGTTVSQVREVAARLKQAGIGVAFFLQFGYPGETWDDIEQTLRLVWDCDPDDIGMSVSYPLAGTPFHERVREHMSGRQNWIDSDDMAMLYRGPYPTAFYRRLHARLHAEFRLRKACRGRPWPAVAWSAVAGGRPRRALTVLRDAFALPVHRARLGLARRHGADETVLPVRLTREAAASPSLQEEPVAASTASQRGGVAH